MFDVLKTTVLSSAELRGQCAKTWKREKRGRHGKFERRLNKQESSITVFYDVQKILCKQECSVKDAAWNNHDTPFQETQNCDARPETVNFCGRRNDSLHSRGLHISCCDLYDKLQTNFYCVSRPPCPLRWQGLSKQLYVVYVSKGRLRSVCVITRMIPASFPAETPSHSYLIRKANQQTSLCILIKLSLGLMEAEPSTSGRLSAYALWSANATSS